MEEEIQVPFVFFVNTQYHIYSYWMTKDRKNKAAKKYDGNGIYRAIPKYFLIMCT